MIILLKYVLALLATLKLLGGEKAFINGVFSAAILYACIVVILCNSLRSLFLILLMKTNKTYPISSFLVNIQAFSAEECSEAAPVRSASCIDLKSIFCVCIVF